MKVTPALKKELAQWLETYWSTYLKGDIETWATFIRDDYRNIGGTKEEIWHNKQEIIDYTKSILDQMLGAAEVRNREIEVIPYGEYLMVNEFTDLYVKVEGEWNFYGPFRMSSLLEKTDTSWIALHQHGSFPDMKALKGEAFSIDSLKAENAKLQEAVKRRTVELEQKNRDLEIEASLERVRAVALGMNKPEDMLDICRIISDQLELLGIENIRNIQTAIIDEEKGIYLCYQYFTPYGKTAIENTEYLKSPVEFEMVGKMLESQHGHFCGILRGKALEDFRIHRKEENHFPDPLLDQASVISYCFLSIGEGGLGLSLYQLMEERVLTLFNRFHQVFSLAYQRFRDIQKAEAQAREAQIEAALERVRTKTMAMHSSADVDHTVITLFDELLKLGVDKSVRSGIGILNQSRIMEVWTGSTNLSGQTFLDKGILDMGLHPLLTEVQDAWEAKKTAHTYELVGDDLIRYFKAIDEAPDYSLKVDFKKLPAKIFHYDFFFPDGFLFAFSPSPFSEETTKLFSRFAAVFAQTYRRFLDLQKAEAQARESQIQLALERVRARTMAMHHSSELADTATILFQQIKELGFEIWSCGFGIWRPEVDLEEAWMSTGDLFPIIMTPFREDPTHLSIYEASQRGESVFEVEVKGEVLTKHYGWLMSQPSFKIVFGQIENSGIILPTVQFKYAAFFKQGYLHLITTKPQPDIHNINQRFAKVFEQTYTRFLDLQKAEAQAREAEIELALERVRARTMAMHHTEELKEVIQVVFDQFVGLHIDVQHAGFILDYKEREDMHIWLADHQQGVPTEITIPYFDSPHWNSYLAAKANQESFFANLLPFEVKNKFYRDLFEWIPELTEEAQQAIFGEPGLAISTVLLDNVGLYIEHYSETPFTEEENAILMRFGKVFQQTYTRFLDLQKAEAQAREAQIQLSLERVRSKAMAMHNSDDLSEVLSVLFEQFEVLAISPVYTFLSFIDVERNTFTYRQTGRHGQKVLAQQTISMDAMNIWKDVLDRWKSGVYDTIDTVYCPKELLPEVFKIYDEIFSQLPEGAKVFQEDFPDGIYTAIACSKFGHLGYDHNRPSTEEEKSILLRFNTEFVRLYQRFLDLQKAEAQARESQIQLALERVRARTMAMHKSHELADVAVVLYQELKILGVTQEFFECGYVEVDEKNNIQRAWSTKPDGSFLKEPYYLPLTGEPVIDARYEAWKQRVPVCHQVVGGELLKRANEFVIPSMKNQEAAEITSSSAVPDPVHFYCGNFSHGYLNINCGESLGAEEESLLARFTGVFEMTYQRFLDLQKAEAQAREAQIQLALERVRARTMAMQSSEELAEVSYLLNKQIVDLGIPTRGCAFNIYNEHDSTEWFSNLEGTIPTYKTPRENIFLKYYEAGQRGETLWIEEFGGDRIKEHYKYLATLAVSGKEGETIEADVAQVPEYQIDHVAYFKYGYLLFITLVPAPEAHDIFKRFAKEFEQTYTRFLDLQKAEAQARESQIQLALERVRARTMAMQHSSELSETSALLFQQIQLLGVPPWSCGFNIWEQGDTFFTSYMGSPDGTILDGFKIPLTEEATFIHFQESRDRGDKLFVEVLKGKTLEEHYRYFLALPGIKEAFEKRAQEGDRRPDFQIHHLANFSHGNLMFITYEPCPEAHDIFIRFAKVFEQTYTRFLDLQKAEAQAREAQIEAALEKVRSRSLAMQSPDELIEVAQLLREEMGALGVEELETSSIYILDASSGLTECWFTIKNTANPAKAVTDQMTIRLEDTWVGRQMREFFHSPAEKTSIVMRGENRLEWIHYCEGKTNLFGTSNFYGDTIPDRTYHLYKFSNGYIGAASPGEISHESWDLLRRATTVFSFAYTRFQDLQNAQASARTAMRQASLDRIRADISSMRNADDLDRITPLIFKELTVLGVPFIRCGVFIINEKQELVEAYLSSPDGNSLGVLRLPYSASELTIQTVEAWRKDVIYRQHWNKEDFIQWINQLMEQDQIQDRSTYQGTAAPPESLDLHFVPFKQGMLYVGAVNPLEENELELVQALAKAFSIAYARYEDFVKLENAKAEVESAMKELKATQSQLIQAEKMASLGELTAGIAHEIQNPLNFVNNFSEVSAELIDEIQDIRRQTQDRATANEEDEILEDIKQNLEKITLHGKRADAIVKGMLEHSKRGSGQKEQTDLNALADDFLRLTYQSFLAKDPNFKVELQTNLDPDLPKISVIPQDIGKVLLNLYSNAFYACADRLAQSKAEVSRSAVAEKANSSGSDYISQIKVSTKQLPPQGGKGGYIEISVSDNGPGIPDTIKDKIFQPFFTTKPTGQGTGLGLSLSYDIVKAHGGELKVETKEGEGSEFTITLPFKSIE